MPEIAELKKIRDHIYEAASIAGSLRLELVTRMLGLTLLELDERLNKQIKASSHDGTKSKLHLVEDDYRPKVIGTWEWDIQQKLFYADPGVAKIYNLEPQAAASGVSEDQFRAALHPDDASSIETAIQRAIKDGHGFSVVYRLVQNDKTVKLVFAIGHAVFENGVAVRFPATVIDVISDEQRMGQIMQYSEKDV